MTTKVRVGLRDLLVRRPPDTLGRDVDLLCVSIVPLVFDRVQLYKYTEIRFPFPFSP
jgi:hypothetical protein